MSGKWLVRVDTGGTFTDGWARSPEGAERRCKVLSSGILRGEILLRKGRECLVSGFENYPEGFFVGWSSELGRVVGNEGNRFQFEDEVSSTVPAMKTLELTTGEEAPVVAARVLTGTRLEEGFPEIDLRVATTRGTNALLEGKGTPPVLFVTKGFRDLPEIRDQRRPDLFARAIVKNAAITRNVVEVGGRVSAVGEELEEFDESAFRQAAREQFTRGHRVAVVAFLHSDRFPEMERQAARILREAGFEEVTVSSQMASRLGYLSRMETALANGYLAPVMNTFKRRVSGVGEVSFLTSAGGLQARSDYEPVDSLLSGPAGGLVGALAVARAAGCRRVLTFDMGGTSTDVARLEDAIAFRYEQSIGPVKVRRPGVRMETVAAGGGSICRWHNGGLEVGPRSAGADPGPACYGRGGPLTVTDVNLLLGHLNEERMEIPLDRQAAEARFEELREAMRQAGAKELPAEELLRGLRAIAIERMAEAVRSISVREGFEPKDYALVAFGGAGPQHACDLAESLGVRKVLVPGDAGLLSAWGLHRAVREVVAERQLLKTCGYLASEWPQVGEELAKEALADIERGEIRRWLVEMRLAGQESTLEIATTNFPALEDLESRFARRYQEVFGYRHPQDRGVEIVMVRAVAGEPEEARIEEAFGEGESIVGLVETDYCTLVANEGWLVRRGERGSFLLERQYEKEFAQRTGAVAAELMRARFESVAESMGELLRRTALSTNVKERLDFSCALLDARGRLVVNAPHIPVHLGALGVCVRRVSEDRVWQPGDMVVVNHPGFGGSHLPDVTVVSPVFTNTGNLVAFVANRAHHSEIGGKASGSMPGDARSLHEEGVVIAPLLLFSEGRENFDELSDLLTDGEFPTRALEENLADLRAQAAANQAGVRNLQGLVAEFGEAEVLIGMESVVERARGLMADKMAAQGSWERQVADALDDGTPLKLAMRSRDGKLTLDFSGSAPLHGGNLNATAGVTRSAVLYALRLWIDEDLPLNEGLLDAVEILAEGTFLSPEFPADVKACPAVVGGNVETSQRVVEMILRALELSAESQGTMNNFLFGNDRFGYYETIGGGAGAIEGTAGASGVHVHMTNTSITDPEVLEFRFPVRLHQFALREGSGGLGEWRGGDGLVREVEFLEKMEVTFLTQHRKNGPRGLKGGSEGSPGRQMLWRQDRWNELSPITTFLVEPGERVRIETPGGGGWGDAG